MARPKKIDSLMLVKIVEEFYEEEANGNPSRLKFSRIEAYAAKKGCGAKAYDFSRDQCVRKRILELTEMAALSSREMAAAAYKSLDIDQMVRGCSSLEELKKSLYEMDQYWKNVYLSSSEAAKRDRQLLAEKSCYEERITKLLEENKKLSERAAADGKEARSLQRENVYLRRMLKTYLYPNVANEILRESHLPVTKNTAVRPETFHELIEGTRPLPFGGAPAEKPKPMTRQEQLLEEMKNQVQQNGK